MSPSLTSGVVRVAHGFEASDTVAPVWRDVPAALMHDPSGDWPIFVPFETWPALRALLLGPRLQAVAEVRSTCSFHQRGLRERFVHATRPAEVDGVPVLPYLGGPSRATMTEISAYQERWAGWWIRYDANALTREHRNPLPPLAETFQREKVLLCQHGVRLRPYVDAEGRFVSKDVYPVAFPRAGGNVWALGAVLGSTVFTALYNTLFQGLLCGGETYHYLPALLAQVPVPPQEAWDAEGWERAVRALQVQGGPDPELWDALDRSVTEAYGLDPAILPGLRAVHLRRVGAECPADGAC